MIIWQPLFVRLKQVRLINNSNSKNGDQIGRHFLLYFFDELILS